MQQGGTASPFDRGMGIKYGVESSIWFEEQLKNAGINSSADVVNITAKETVCLLGISRRKHLFTPLVELIEQTDFQLVLIIITVVLCL